jgi:hypothetical protein
VELTSNFVYFAATAPTPFWYTWHLDARAARLTSNPQILISV